MRYINLRFTYLLYLLTYLLKQAAERHTIPDFNGARGDAVVVASAGTYAFAPRCRPAPSHSIFTGRTLFLHAQPTLSKHLLKAMQITSQIS